jgi:S1-C subfamily serine protease
VRLLVAAALLLAACSAPAPAPPDSVVPGTIGVTVREQESRVVITAVARGGAAAQRGVRAGDVVLRYNGEEIRSVRQFNRLVVESAPGSRAQLELMRGADLHVLELPVRQLDIQPLV